MPWSTYDHVIRAAGSVDTAEKIAEEFGATELGPPTFEDWWEGRISAASVLVLAALRAQDYAPPEDPDDLSVSDASILAEAIASQAVLEARPHEVRDGGNTKYPVPELAIRLRQILGDVVALDMPRSTAATGSVFVATVTTSTCRPVEWLDGLLVGDAWGWP